MTKKELRFKEFDVAVKYKRREKECDTGRLLVKKVKNRSSKLLKKVLEKTDLTLNMENAKLIEELKTKATTCKE